MMLFTEARPKQLTSDTPDPPSTAKPKTVAMPPKMNFSLYPTCEFKIQYHMIYHE